MPMKYLDNKEKKISKQFLKNGYIIGKIENINALTYIKSTLDKNFKNYLNFKKQINLNYLHQNIEINKLNDLRLSILRKINNDKKFHFNYFSLAKKNIYNLAGNELMMQKNINLSIQLPNDKSSLLPIHSDVWSGDSPFEINLWIPLVNVYKTKSMYILQKKHYAFFLKKIKEQKHKTSDDIFRILKNKIKWLEIKYGEFLIFDQGLPHGNVVNKEKETRVSLNCRFKNFFSPFGDKKLGEFFIPITTRAMTEIGLKYEDPFKK